MKSMIASAKLSSIKVTLSSSNLHTFNSKLIASPAMNESAVRQLLFGQLACSALLGGLCCQVSLKYYTIALIRVETMILDKKKEGAAREIPCQDCDQTFVGETGRTDCGLHLSRFWHSALIRRRRVLEAIHIRTRPHTMSVDRGLNLSRFWHSALIRRW